MNLLVFSSGRGTLGLDLAEYLSSFIPPKAFRVVRSRGQLRDSLQEPAWRDAVLLLCAQDEEQVDALLDMRDELTDRRLALVLPGASREVVAKAHRLYPRFVTQETGHWEDLAEVLARMGVLSLNLETSSPEAAPYHHLC